MSAAISTEQVTIEQATIERIDDIPLLVVLQQRVGLSEIIDQIIPRHWLHQGLSLGQLVLGWNTFILSEGDHRKVTVQDWAIQHRTVLEELLGEPIRNTDFTDDRLGQVLTYLSDDKATQALLALTPEAGRGRKQIRCESQLIKSAEAILQRFGVKEYLHYTFRREESTYCQYVGRGRGGKNRPKRTVKKVCYQITGIHRDEAAIAAAYWRMGWRLYATNQQSAELPINKAIWLYRQAPRIERHFHLLKDAPVGIEPLYVRRDDQIKGLVRLLVCPIVNAHRNCSEAESVTTRGEVIGPLRR